MTGKSFVKALHLWVQSVFINNEGNLTTLLNHIKINFEEILQNTEKPIKSSKLIS
jgi:hypothetical protein